MVDFGIKKVSNIASLKAFTPISLRFDSTLIITFLSFVHHKKQYDSKDVISFGTEIDEIEVDSKQKEEIDFRLVGRITFVNYKHPLNAYDPILVKSSQLLKSTDESFVHW